MHEIQIRKYSELSPDELAFWAETQATEPALASPYFHPGFTSAVDSVRSDVRVATIRRAGRLEALFPFQLGHWGLGKPVGGKLSDYHGLIARPGVELKLAELIRACGLASFEFDHLPAAQTAFASAVATTGSSPYLDLSGGYPAYATRKREAGSDTIAKTAQKARKLQREQGELTYDWHDPQPETLAQLRVWKSEQYLRTGLSDIFRFPWTVRLLETILARSTDDFGALVSVLRVRGKPAAILYALRSRGVAHAWFTAYNRELAAYSPGLILFLRFAEAAESRGISRLDLGRGDERFKASLATAAAPVCEGVIDSPAFAVWLRNGWRRTRKWALENSLARSASAPIQWLKPVREWLAYE